MSNFLNDKVGQCDVVKIEKSPMSKNDKCDFSVFDNKKWKLKSSHRGKEMIIKLTSGLETHSIKVNFAKIGSLEYFPIDKIDKEYLDKRGMIRFYTEDTVYFISDFSRYVIWRWSDEWDTRRSPDVFVEHNDWRDFMYKNRKIPYFNRPVFDILTDQRFFNGIGNFTRSEILARTRFSPFTHFSEILSTDVLRDDFFLIVKETMTELAELGGMQFKHWINPYGVNKDKFNIWIRCYNKIPHTYYTKDSRGRIFWFMKRWIPDYVEWMRGRIHKIDEELDTRLLEKIYKKNIK